MKPQELLWWMRQWELRDELIYKKAATSQAAFIRDRISGNLLKAKCFVVGTHRSKSCTLPVYYIKLRNGVKLIMRENFYDWKMSVDIPSEYTIAKNLIPVDCVSHSVAEKPFEKIHSCYLEGFKEEWSYDAYDPENTPHRFTIEIPDDYRLYTLIHVFKHAWPDLKFDINQDKRTVDEIRESIVRIISENGFNDMYNNTSWGEPTLSRRMSIWEILWRTYCKMDDMYYGGDMPLADFPSVSDDPNKYAEAIMKYPEAHEEFLMEEWMFTDIPL